MHYGSRRLRLEHKIMYQDTLFQQKCFVQLTSSCYPSRNATGLFWSSFGFWRIANLGAPPYIDRHLARMCQYPSSWMVSLLTMLPATRVFCMPMSAVGGGSLLSPEGEKVNGGNLYPLSNAGQMQILCWLSCCAMCWQGGLTVSPSLLFGGVVQSSVAARFFLLNWDLDIQSSNIHFLNFFFTVSLYLLICFA